MQFGPLPIDQAEGAILVHSLSVGKGRIRKGTVLSHSDLDRLAAAGHESVTVARLEADDVREDDAAERLARMAAGPGLKTGTPGTGRCSLFAEHAGLLLVDKVRIDAFNAVDEAVTLATLRAYERVDAGQMAATVKIITFAVPDGVLEQCRGAIGDDPPVRLAPFRTLSAALLQSRQPGDKESLIDKTVDVTRRRLLRIGASLDECRTCDHEEESVAQALAGLVAQKPDVILVMGSSAIVDRRDVVPAAIERAGGRIEHFGMPVDPGNLTLLADLHGIPLLGLPGSARSPRPHGFDWILDRIAAGVPVTGADITAMGVGGLLKEIPGRPMPRLEAAPSGEARERAGPRVHALVLAAGQSRRMGKTNKLLADIGGKPLVRRVAESVLAASVAGVTVVTGHQSDHIRAALDGLDLAFAHNADYAEGLSTSLRTGIAAVPEDADAALVCLGDMPAVDAAILDRLIAAYEPARGKTIVVPVRDGKRGNPVLWGKVHFPALQDIAGDVGARHLIGEHQDAVIEVPVPEDAIFVDLDTPDALAAYRNATAKG